jgi:hypothetical protein
MRELFPKCILPPQSKKSVWAPPLDLRDLVVRLEAEGITASVSRSRYGHHDVWSLADAYLPVAQAQTPITAPDVKNARRVREYVKGMAFAAPLICSCLAVLFLRISLWGGGLTGNEAAAIAIATVAGFVVSGGFVQVIGRQGHFYKQRGEWAHCYRACSSFAWTGLLCLMLCSVFGFVANAYFGWLPLRLLGWCTAFHLGIGSYLLISAVLYVIDGELLVALGTIIGIGIVVALNMRLGVPVLIAQISGIIAATAACIVFALLRFRHLGAYRSEAARLGTRGRLFYMLWPYFTYGLAYYLFLFTDRIIAWSARTENASLPIQFRGEYETAVDICLFAFIMQVGWVHSALVNFYRVVTSQQKKFRLDGREELKKVLLAFYSKQMIVFGGLFVASTVLSVVLIEQIPPLRDMLDFRVALLGLLATPLLAVGLWNIALLFALSRPLSVLASVGWAVALNISVGYLLSRLFSYDLAIVGFDIGTCALACVSGWFCRKLLSNFDYHYFAATV